MEAVGQALRSMHGVFTTPRATPQGRLMVVKAGTFARTVIWPCFVPLGLYQYIRGVDRDMFALDLLAYRSGTTYPEEFYDKTKGTTGGHWRMQKDMEVIYKATHPGAS